ncbi:MAG: tetratricopeptide repeat protein [Cyclobacteriaceae bacterium]
MRNPSPFVFSFVIFLIAILVVPDATAQRKKSKKNDPPQLPLTRQDELKIEATFIEAEKHILLEDYDKAYELLEVAQTLNPTNPTIYFKLAEVTVKKGGNEMGLFFIDKAIELDKKNKYFYFFKAEIHKAINQLEEAAATFETLLEELPENHHIYYELAAIYTYQGKLDMALDAYEKAEAHYGLSPEIVREKQKIYLRQNDLESLIADWDRIIEANPDESKFQLEFATILIANNKFTEATERLNDVKQAFPDESNVELLLADIAIKENRIADALLLLEVGINASSVPLISKMQLINSLMTKANSDEMKQSLRNVALALAVNHPDEYQAQAFVGDVLNFLEKKEEALSYFKKAVTIGPGEFAVWQQIVAMEFEESNYDSVMHYCDEAMVMFPNQAVFYFYSGVSLYIENEHKKSVRVLEQGKKVAADPYVKGLIFAQLGDAYNSLKDYVKSDESYESALVSDPSNDHVLNNYSYFLSLRGERLDRALKMSSQLATKYPDNPTYLDTHGWVLFKMGEYEKAKKYLEKAADLEPDGTIIEHLGDVLFKLDKTDEAVEKWKEAKEVGGTSDLIDKKIEDRTFYE